MFAAGESADLRAAARVLGAVVGSTTIYLPGTPMFDAMFICPGSPIPMPPGSAVSAAKSRDTARGVA